MDAVIYEDSPYYDVWIKSLIVLPIFFVLIGVYYVYIKDVPSAVGLFGTGLLMGLIYWLVFPRKYQVMDRKLKIMLGGPFSFNIPFDTLETVGKPEGFNVGLNFATTFISEHAVEIKRKKGMTVNITPGNRDLFLENLNKAVYDWKSGRSKVSV